MRIIAALTYATTLGFYSGMLAINVARPNLSGDQAMAYGLGIIFFAAGFFVSLVGLAWSLTAGGFLNWISPRPTRRMATVILGTVSLGITFFLAAALKWETWDNAPWLVRWLSAHYGFAWIPWLLFVPCGLLLVRRQLAGIGYLTIRLPLAAMLGICAAFVLGSLMGWSRDASQAQQARLEELRRQDQQQLEQRWEELAAWQPEQGLGPLLPLTNRFQDQSVREAALAKLYSLPDWEAQLLDILEGPRTYRAAYDFLDGNRISDTAKFAVALENSIRWMADSIRTEVAQTNNLQEWSFEWYRADSALRAFDFQFSTAEVDFEPAVRDLLSALDDNRPAQFAKVQLKISAVVQRWLKQHSASQRR